MSCSFCSQDWDEILGVAGKQPWELGTHPPVTPRAKQHSAGKGAWLCRQGGRTAASSACCLPECPCSSLFPTSLLPGECTQGVVAALACLQWHSSCEQRAGGNLSPCKGRGKNFVWRLIHRGSEAQGIIRSSSLLVLLVLINIAVVVFILHLLICKVLSNH